MSGFLFWIGAWAIAPWVILYWRSELVSLVADMIAEGIRRSKR